MEHIGFRPQILSLLRRLQQSRCLVAVTLDNDAYIYNSALLEIDAEQDFLILDELKPERGHTALLQQRRCRIRAELRGVTVAFTASLSDNGSRDGIAFYRLSLPKALNYAQRRADYRPRVSHAKKTRVELELSNRTIATGALQDISLGGLRIKLDAETTAIPLNTLLACRLTLPDGTAFICTIELRFFGKSELGGKFIALESGQRQTLQKFIRELEREELKKTHRDNA